jgi:hypothetical protein
MSITAPSETTIPECLEQIIAWSVANPTYVEIAITELNRIVNKFDPQIVNGTRSPLPFIHPDFKRRFKSVQNKVCEAIGQKMTIPDLRFEADALSRECKIPLPQIIRNNKEALMQWFDTHWAQLAPQIRERHRLRNSGG